MRANFLLQRPNEDLQLNNAPIFDERIGVKFEFFVPFYSSIRTLIQPVVQSGGCCQIIDIA